MCTTESVCIYNTLLYYRVIVLSRRYTGEPLCTLHIIFKEDVSHFPQQQITPFSILSAAPLAFSAKHLHDNTHSMASIA